MAFKFQICIGFLALAFLGQCILTKCSVPAAQRLHALVEEDESYRNPSKVAAKSIEVFDDDDYVGPTIATINDSDLQTDELEKVVFSDQTSNITRRDILIISTLDGMITALDIEDNGKVLWKLQTGPGALLSSSISKIEFKSEGKLIRLIPSLNGGIYKFDGEGVEPIQTSADSLLHSSYLSAEDLLITGGKEVRTYGVDASTGHLQYTCSSDGCHVDPIETTSRGDFLIFRRHSKIIRAIEPRSGVERWNFSVGSHEATVLQTDVEAHIQTINQKSEDCFHVVESSLEDKVEKDAQEALIKFKIVVPDGFVSVSSPESPQTPLWMYQFESPIAHAWHLKDGKLAVLDTFDTDTISSDEPSELVQTNPLLYVGLHNQQLYVQESSRFEESILQLNKPSVEKSLVADEKFFWRPLSYKSPMLTFEEDSDCPQEGDRSTALALRPGTNLVLSNGGGVFIYKFSPATPRTTEQFSHEAIDNEQQLPEEEITIIYPVYIVITSLWFWWREVFAISIATAIFFHVLYTRQVVKLMQYRNLILFREFHWRKSPKNVSDEERRSNDLQTVVAIEDTHQETPVPIREQQNPPVSYETTATAYESRYLTDFEPIQCLGRGGFGLVFEVRNRLDDCHYAVKRIQLPNTEAARQKVMREVKALAKLDNPHIVRYFHAWIECPPPGWQESQDALLIDSSEALTGPTPCNTGEEPFTTSSFADCGSSSVNGFSSSHAAQFSKLVKSIDKARRDLTSEEDSLDIVFENSGEYDCEDSESDESSTGSSRETRVDVNSPGLSHSNLSSSDDSLFERDGDHQLSERSSSLPENKKKSTQLRRTKCCSKESRMYLYIQMQLCRKESLREWLRAQVSERDINHVLHMFNDMIRAVEYVHLQGLIHRDLKPSNIFFAPDGSIKIGDFGLVTAMAEEAYALANESHRIVGYSATFRNHTDQVGTQLYMSPEQIEGKPYSYKVDIFSLGLILFELLWPLSTQMEQVLVLTRLRDLKLPAGFDEKFPQEGLLLREMLARNPDERPTTFGIRASAPLLKFQDIIQNPIPEHVHYNLQRPRRTTE